ncbi:MAG: MFS transporter [Methylobacter sp.]|nr:MFS transporter [Methylobacter sp.]MDP2100612.1 MFS transporter [Methylobacter sp.]MDP2428892.1 MFS transporter [Methylobacter sp.]MDP3053361.1 MFS transporter [Methylobacter sp.]MDP3362121.1 MFS transporter [Methylobacter sp.]
MSERPRASNKEIVGWAMFDFANQAYTLLIVTVVFGDLFTRVIVGDAPDYRLGNLLWSLSLATGYLGVVLLSPIAGAVMDYTASKKRFLFASYLLTVISTAALYFVAPGYAWLGVLLLIVSNFAYSIGEAFIASFLPDLGPPEDLGKISGFGWALGYIGGMVSAVFVLLVLGEVSAENFSSIRWVGPWAAFFFLVAAIPTFLWVKEPGSGQPVPAGVSYFSLGFGRMKSTLRQIKEHRDLAILLVSIFFAMSGIYIIITYAFIYGAQVIGWDEQVRTWMFIIVQITAALGAVAFGFVQDRYGALFTYRLTLLLWMLSIALIYLTPVFASTMRTHFGLDWQAQYVFLLVGGVAGLSLGSCQSSTRTLVGLFSPLSRSAEYFGFWGLSMKLAGMLGLLAIGLLQILVGLKSAILFCIVLFAAALFFSRKVDEARGRRAADIQH